MMNHRRTLPSLFLLLLCFCLTALLVKLVQWERSVRPEANNVNTTVAMGGKLAQAAAGDITRAVPFVLIYNSLLTTGNWATDWDKVDESNVVQMTRNCGTECHYTFDRYFQRLADFVLVSISGYDWFDGTKTNLTLSKDNQLWVGYHFEPPPHSWGQGYTMVDDHFHWVANYRRDADIYLPFGKFDPKERPEEDVFLDDIRNSLSNKKLAAWLVSNCGIFEDVKARQLLVQTLQKFMPVEILGKCGKPCPPTVDCYVYLGQNYKFYLAFENSLCADYVSEKLFMAAAHGMVPVVFGWADYSLYAPKDSYINALEYDSVEHLAEYLLYLDQNDDEYLKYFSWRKTYTAQNRFKMEWIFCIICQKMSDHLNKKTSGGPQAQVTKYPSYKEWHEAFPAGKEAQSPTFRLAGRNIFNATKACVKYDEHPELIRWLRGEPWLVEE